jgi:hypothetical protein
VIREELVAGTADRFRYADHITVEVRSSIVNVSQIAFNSPSSDCGTSGATISASTLRSGVLWSSQSATRPQAG